MKRRMSSKNSVEFSPSTKAIARESRRVIKLYLKDGELAWNMGGLEKMFWEKDEQLCDVMFKHAQSNLLYRRLWAVLSFSGDEAIWFILPVIVASILALYHGGPLMMPCSSISCETEFFLDLFGAMSIAAVLEQVLKCFFQRPRPVCRKYRNDLCCIYGEWHSFPSGHSMRAMYAYVWLFNSVHARSLLNLPDFLSPLVLLWSLGVGMARIAAGRHHPVDVIVGHGCGLLLSRYVETSLNDTERVLLKSLCGVIVAIQVWFFLLGPVVYRTSVSKKFKNPGLIKNFVAFCYFSFYISALHTVLAIIITSSAHECPLGRFSYNPLNGMCKLWTF